MGFGDFFNAQPKENVEPKTTEQAPENVQVDVPADNPAPTDNPAPADNPAPTDNPAPIEGDTSTKPAFTERDFLEFAKSKGKEVASIEEFFAEKEPIVQEKIVDPWESVLDDEDRQYLQYKKETGRSRKDFESLNVDFDQVSALDLARERVRKESGQSLSDEQADSYLERKLGVDLTDLNDLQDFDNVELSAYSKSLREEKKAEQQKYKQPIAPKEPTPQEEIVQLDNGTSMKKADYEAMIENHQRHLEQAKASVDSVTEASFKIEFDDNGTKRELSYGYEFSQEDRHSMLSVATDVSGVMEKRYRSEQGFNHKQFQEDMFWSDPQLREKAISSMLSKARAEAIEEQMKNENNVNFSRNSLQGAGKGGTRIVPVGPPDNGLGFGKFFNQQP